MSEERRKKSCKFLGVYLDPLLTWHSHVDALSKNIFALRVLFFSLSSVVLRSIYFALVETHPRYGVLVCSGGGCASRIFGIQRRAGVLGGWYIVIAVRKLLWI